MIYGFIQDHKDNDIQLQQFNNLKDSDFGVEMFLYKAECDASLFKEGDVVVVDTIVRLGNDLSKTLEKIIDIIERDACVVTLRESRSFDKNSCAFLKDIVYLSNIIRSNVTKEALDLKKKEGVKLGRHKGSQNKTHKFEDKLPKIKKLLANGMTMRQAGIKLGIPASSLYNLLKMKNLLPKKD